MAARPLAYMESCLGISIRLSSSAEIEACICWSGPASRRRYRKWSDILSVRGCSSRLQATRSNIMASLEAVELVVVFQEETPIRLLQAIQPDVLIKGGNYSPWV
jgi:hypothetical protein